MSTTHDLVVLGGGPGGYVAAIRAAQLGLNVGCIDENPQFGGTCLRVGCIPSKALLESSHLYHQAAHGLGEHGIQVSGATVDLSAMLSRKDEVVKTLTGGINMLLKRNKVTSYVGRGRLAGTGKLVVNTEDGEQEISAKHIIIATGSKPAMMKGVELSLIHI